MKKILCCLVSVLLVFAFFPAIHADSNTYVLLNGCEKLYNILYGVGDYYWNTDAEVRYTQFYDSSGDYFNSYAVSTSPFSYSIANGNISACPGASTLTSNSTVYNGVTYYYVTQNWNMVRKGEMYFYSNINPYIAGVDLGIYYTYGSGAVAPEPPAPEFGQLSNVGYNTKIAGSGQAAINNVDTVSWNPDTDTAGNDISEMSVSVRVVPGKYSASSRQSLAEKLYSDFVLNTLDATVLDTVTASSGYFSVTWSDVIDKLAIPFATISSLVDQDGTFIKNGWIYQVRLEGYGYEGEWQTVYTATSSGVQNDLTIIQSTTINQTLVNTITEINQLNNTSNNWYINETTINMSDYNKPSEGDKPWWAYLLEAIVSLINKLIEGISSIVGAIANLVGDIIDGILGLFTFDSFSVPDFSTHQQNIHDNSGIFGESIDILQTINQTISNADSTAEPILYYPGIDLEGVEFIPEITINLNNYVDDLGLTQWHNLAYTCTDIFIWTTLIYTIYRKLIGVFKK